MNKTRRADIAKLISALEELLEPLELNRDATESIQGDEQEYFDNMPESFQSGEKGEAAEAAAEKLQEAYDALDAAKDALQEAIDALGEAAE